MAYDDEEERLLRSVALQNAGAILLTRQKVERELAAEKERLRITLASIGDAVISTDAECRVTYLNQVAETLTGWTQEEAAGQPLPDVFHILNEQTRQPAANPALKALQEGVVVGLANHTVLIARDGSERPVDDSAAPMLDESGIPVGAVLVFRDVSERRRAEEDLRASEQRFRTLTSHAPVGIFLTDREGNCLFVNERWCEMSGLSPEEARGQGWARALHPDDSERVFHEWSSATEEGRPFAGEYRFLTPQGKVTWVEGSAVGLLDETGQAKEYIGTITDITARKEAVDALKEADRRKDEFLALLAHELRNPLAPLRNGLEVMRLASADASVVAKLRDMMARQLSHMVRLIDDLLDVSRISRNKIELRRSQVLLADVIRSAVETARPAIEAAGHELTVSLPREPIHLDADLTRLAQVFGNLLNNSAKYTEQSGHIWLTATRAGDHVQVVVRDTGIGIPGFALPNIFEMFNQVDRSIERRAGGLGIGLALVKGLVEMHGGTVEAASPSPGKGSTFTVRLPVLEERAESPIGKPAEELPDSTGPKRRILVVDDNQDSAASMATMLHLLGNEVRTANDGIEAVARAEQFRPHVVLMDIGMPKLNGYEATRRIREQPWGRDMAIIALTGWGQEEDRTKSKEAGCDDHLLKPVHLPDLQKLLAELQSNPKGPG